MRQLNLPDYSRRFEKTHYRRELELHPPDVVVIPIAGEWAYEPEQSAVIAEYLAAHRDEYEGVGRDMLRALMVRRDRAPRSAGPGLLP